jgi:alpha-L-fucosidase
LNIGPKGDGEFDAKDQQILDSIGKWMDVNSASIYKTTKTPLPFQNWGVSTRQGNLLYLQVFNWPKDGKLIIGGLKSNIKKAYLLSDAAKKSLLVNRVSPLDVQLTVPLKAPDQVSSVIVVETNGTIVADPVRTLDAKNYTNRLLAFDSDMKLGDFHFGDGKTGKYFIDRWNKKDRAVSWKFRLLLPAKYKVLIKYAADADNAGTYELTLGNLKKTETVTTNAKGDKIIEQALGEVSLQPGTHTLKITPVEIQKSGLMKILEVQLIPLR